VVHHAAQDTGMNQLRQLGRTYVPAHSLARRTWRRIRKSYSRLADSSLRLQRAIRILRSGYPELIRDEGLHTRFYDEVPATMLRLREENAWTLFAINGFNFYWPQGVTAEPLTWIYREVFAPGDRNPHAYEYGAVRISRGMWVVDAGACEGFFTHYALQRGANVLAMEPVAILAEALQRTFRAEIESGRVRVVQAALGGRSGSSGIRTSQHEIYCSTLSAAGNESVPVYSLDDLVKNGLAPALDFVKMDIEGSEVAVLAGASNVLQELKPRLSVAVYHEEANARLIRNLIRTSEQGYRVTCRGVWDRDNVAPRPYMLFAYPDETIAGARALKRQRGYHHT
jgi:FkbM family methyltransferase